MISSGSQTFRRWTTTGLFISARTRGRLMARNTFHSVMITTALTLSSQIVDLLGLAFLDFPDDTGGVGDITVVQQERQVARVRIDVEVINPVSIEGRGPALQAADFAALGQEQIGSIGTGLLRDARDQRSFAHDSQLPSRAKVAAQKSVGRCRVGLPYRISKISIARPAPASRRNRSVRARIRTPLATGSLPSERKLAGGTPGISARWRFDLSAATSCGRFLLHSHHLAPCCDAHNEHLFHRVW
jgi:hypothetical protein